MTIDKVQPQPIRLLPEGPRPTDPVDVFRDKAFNTVLAQEQMIPEINAATEATYQNAQFAEQEATKARAEAVAAEQSASNSELSNQAAGTRAAASEASSQQAQTSAAAAAQSAEQSATALSDLSRLYLGPKTEVPTKDNQGRDLAQGAWFVYTGANPDLVGWHWWDGQVWVLGVGDVAGAYMPKAGGVFEGHISVPAGASGSQAISAREAATLARAPFTTEFIDSSQDLQADRRYICNLDSLPTLALNLTATTDDTSATGARIEVIPVGDILRSSLAITADVGVTIQLLTRSGMREIDSTQGLQLDMTFSKFILEKVLEGRWLLSFV